MAGEINTSELNLFIAYCQSLSKASLIHEIQHGRLNLDQSLLGQNQIDDFALDCIADLFARDDRGDLFLIRRVFASMIDTPDFNTGKVVPTLRKLICSRVHQSLISLFSRVDKGGWKIWRNLSLVTKRHPHIHEFTYLTNCYFYFDEFDKERSTPQGLNPNGDTIPDEILDEWIRQSLKEHYGLPQSMATLFIKLAAHDEYQQFISRSQIYHHLKNHLNISYTDVETMESIGGSTSENDDFDVHPVTADTLSRLKSFIHHELSVRYLLKGKIESDLEAKYTQILELYFSDLLSDGYVEKLQQYLELTGCEPLMNGDWLNHRGRLEYLIKLGKKWLRTEMELTQFPMNPKMRVYN